MWIKSSARSKIRLEDQDIEEVDSFVYLGSTVTRTGGTLDDVALKINKANAAFMALRNIWKNRSISRTTKLKIFRSNVKSILLYGSETWLFNNEVKWKLQTFINRCLRRIFNIHWPETVSNQVLWDKSRWGTCGGTNQKKEMALDRSHPQEELRFNWKKCSRMEPAGNQTQRTSSRHLAANRPRRDEQNWKIMEWSKGSC